MSLQFHLNQHIINWAVTCGFQQCGILAWIDSEESVQPPFKLRNSKWCSVSRWIFIEYSSNQQRLWSDCTYAQAGLSLCWSHIPHCWKSHVAAQLSVSLLYSGIAKGFKDKAVTVKMKIRKNMYMFWVGGGGKRYQIMSLIITHNLQILKSFLIRLPHPLKIFSFINSIFILSYYVSFQVRDERIK